jgi:hypothetical protein
MAQGLNLGLTWGCVRLLRIWERLSLISWILKPLVLQEKAFTPLLRYDIPEYFLHNINKGAVFI